MAWIDRPKYFRRYFSIETLPEIAILPLSENGIENPFHKKRLKNVRIERDPRNFDIIITAIEN